MMVEKLVVTFLVLCAIGLFFLFSSAKQDQIKKANFYIFLSNFCLCCGTAVLILALYLSQI